MGRGIGSSSMGASEKNAKSQSRLSTMKLAYLKTAEQPKIEADRQCEHASLASSIWPAPDQTAKSKVQSDATEEKKYVDRVAPGIEDEAGEKQQCVSCPQAREQEIQREDNGQKGKEKKSRTEEHA